MRLVAADVARNGTLVRGRRVLIVEDEAGIREALADILHDEGFDVEGAENGAIALARLRSAEPPCVVLLDLMMPVMSGWQVVQAMRDSAALNDIPVVVVTANPAHSPSGPPVRAVLSKPVDIERLVETVRSRCPLRRADG